MHHNINAIQNIMRKTFEMLNSLAKNALYSPSM